MKWSVVGFIAALVPWAVVLVSSLDVFCFS
jgi:hypothetical protein